MRSREKRNLVSSKDEKKQHRVRVLLGERCVRTNATLCTIGGIYCLVVRYIKCLELRKGMKF